MYTLFFQLYISTIYLLNYIINEPAQAPLPQDPSGAPAIPGQDPHAANSQQLQWKKSLAKISDRKKSMSMKSVSMAALAKRKQSQGAVSLFPEPYAGQQGQGQFTQPLAAQPTYPNPSDIAQGEQQPLQAVPQPPEQQQQQQAEQKRRSSLHPSEHPQAELAVPLIPAPVVKIPSNRVPAAKGDDVQEAICYDTSKELEQLLKHYMGGISKVDKLENAQNQR